MIVIAIMLILKNGIQIPGNNDYNLIRVRLGCIFKHFKVKSTS